jgi:molecular chaperone DnaK
MVDATISQSTLSDLRGLLRKTLNDFHGAATDKLSAQEIKSAKAQLDTVEELIRRIETGYVWISLYGRVNVGKSSIGNSLIGEDAFEVGPLHDVTSAVHFRPLEQRKGNKFMIVDVPGFLGKEINEQTAREEAQKAHGLIFVLEGEPLEAELKLFDYVKQVAPSTPIWVFVNKLDVLKYVHRNALPTVQERIREKMAKYVVDPQTDILFGDARRLEGNEWVRQPLDELMNRLYDDAGLFGDIMNILDPAERAERATAEIKEKVLAIRERTARSVIKAYATAAVVGGAIPFDQIATIPALTLLSSHIARIMGKAEDAGSLKEHTVRVWKQVVPRMWKDFAVIAAADVAFSVFGLATGTAVFMGLLDAALLGKKRWARMTAFGETVLELTKNDFNWNKLNVEQIVRACKRRAKEEYNLFQKRRQDVVTEAI